MKLLLTLSVVVCVLKVMRADVSELNANKDRLYLPPTETQQHENQSEISENKITLPRSEQAILTASKEESSSHIAAAISQDDVKIKTTKPTLKSITSKTNSKNHKKSTKNTKKLKDSHHGQSSNRHERFHDKDYDFVPSANAPEVIYRAGDKIQFDDTPYHDILDNEDPTYAASNIDTDKRADGYHYTKPLNSFNN